MPKTPHTTWAMRKSLAPTGSSDHVMVRVCPAHDAQMMAQLAPMGMIFVPSVGGISHNVKEFTALPDIEAGTNVLLQTVLRLAS